MTSTSGISAVFEDCVDGGQGIVNKTLNGDGAELVGGFLRGHKE